MKIIITEHQNEKLNKKIRLAVEKLGLVQAREMFGDEIIKQVYIDNPLSYLEQFNELRPIEKEGQVFYHDGHNIIFYYWPITKGDRGLIEFSYKYIWSFFMGVMGFSNSQINTLIKKWLRKTYKLSGYTPMAFNDLDGRTTIDYINRY